RQGGVEKVVGTRPNVDEDQRPEVDDGEPVGIDGASRRLRQVIVHDAEDGRGQEEGHGVVAVPPLHQGVLNAAEDGIAVHQAGGNLEVVDDVEHRHGHDGGDVEPEGDVEGAL